MNGDTESNEGTSRLSVKDPEINCCDYDAISLYPSGTFNVQHKTSLDGKVKEIARIPYGPQVTDSFKDGAYQTFLTTEPIILYRVFGQYRGEGSPAPKGARLNDSFASTEFAESIIDAKLLTSKRPPSITHRVY